MDGPFISYAQNHEDVVLWRALGHVVQGTYLDVGANDPVVDSVTYAFYERGWRGIGVEPIHAFAEAHRQRRPDDVVVEMTIADTDEGEVILYFTDTVGLSTLLDSVIDRDEVRRSASRAESVGAERIDSLLDQLEWDGRPIHFMSVHVTEASALATIDLNRWRPWVLLVGSTEPNSPSLGYQGLEPLVLDAGYQFCLFDGLSRYYVANEHRESIGPQLSYPACAYDGYVPVAQYQAAAEAADRDALRVECDRLQAENQQLTSDLVHWRGEVLERWVEALGARPDPVMERELAILRQELADTRATVSWRVTKPLRAVRGATRGSA